MRTPTLLATAVVLVTQLASPLSSYADGPAGYQWFEYNGHKYALTKSMGSWLACKAEAEAVGGHLVTIANEAENDFLVATFEPTNAFRMFWIGLRQVEGSPEPGGGWVWITGEEAAFLNWRKGEPNNSVGNDIYAAIWDSQGGWNDLGNDTLYGIIEIDGIVDMTPPSVPHY